MSLEEAVSENEKKESPELEEATSPEEEEESLKEEEESLEYEEGVVGGGGSGIGE